MAPLDEDDDRDMAGMFQFVCLALGISLTERD